MAKALAIPRDAEETREMLTDRATLTNIMSDPETAAEWIENSITSRLKHDPGITNQVEMQAEQFMRNWLKDHQSNTDEISARLNLAAAATDRRAVRPSTVYNKNAIGAKHDKLFNGGLSEFFHNISNHAFKNAALSEKLETLSNDLSSVKPSDGGFLIPEVLRSELLRVALERAIVRSRARVIPMDSLTVPFPAVDSTSNVSSIYGGVIGYWTEEGATLTESQPRFAQVELRAHKLALYTEVPNELIRDSKPALEAFLNDIFPEAIAWFEDIAFFVGGGVGEPLGFLNAPAAISADRAGSSSGTVSWADIVEMYIRMLPSSLDRAVWVVSPDVLRALLTMPFTAAGTEPILLGGGGGFPTGSVGAPMTILGRPVIVSEKARALGTSGDINFVDFGYYLIGDRQAMSARQSEDYKFQNDVTAFRVIQRLDGRPWLLNAITPQNNSSNTLSAFVKLTTA